MIDWFSKNHRDQKKRDAHEKDLKQSLAKKISEYEEIANNQEDDHTEVFIGGKKIRVAKEQINIQDVDSGNPPRSK